ncbi:MAG: lyase family protein, partial [Acidobacteriota bacterium]
MAQTENLWGGRFKEKPDATLEKFNKSFRFDRRLFNADVRGSVAQANALHRACVLSNDETSAIVAALGSLMRSADEDEAFFDSEAEDVHSFIETKLV